MQEKSEFLSERDVIDINALASSIADYYFPHGQIDPIVIADKNNITSSFGNYSDSFDGLLECEDNDFHIFINLDRLQQAYSERARFTFGHELGHYFIDDHRNSLLKGLSPSHCSFTGFKSKNRAERQADYFASCLLMPETSFRKYCFQKKFQYRIIQELAKKYGTSISATALRFCSIGNHPIMVVYAYDKKIKWYWSSSDFRFRWLKYGKDKLPEDTVAGEYFELNRKITTTEPVFAMDWFNIKYSHQAELPFKEHCLARDKHTLSLIWEE
ncbi:MAG: ImmA/IrrE family metallo-endopeptidase [Allomuricauda sp.]|uniref:ImmA/IrrE family metallo-endopeptidase n=1 Tax=Flagellimonas oceani TaxID=2698672 RepID=A0A6G7J8D1_9FLAO|nr:MULTISPECIES: ImmA/IrrE family metallo-endopeptidase [Allomuricauda]MBW8241905.1 ImmA/IrrE family metallo-endopeptidase [Allomuricauda oceani]QII46818.1 ImmA/IrrE family metallo-endopeptidase [Allomuricauda oceani]